MLGCGGSGPEIAVWFKNSPVRPESWSGESENRAVSLDPPYTGDFVPPVWPFCRSLPRFAARNRTAGPNRSSRPPSATMFGSIRGLMPTVIARSLSEYAHCPLEAACSAEYFVALRSQRYGVAPSSRLVLSKHSAPNRSTGILRQAPSIDGSLEDYNCFHPHRGLKMLGPRELSKPTHHPSRVRFRGTAPQTSATDRSIGPIDKSNRFNRLDR
jgi:hypothetical protein